MAAQMPPQYTPSAEKPLMEGMRAKLVRALDENESLFEIMLMMEDVVEDLSQVQGVSIANTLDSFKEGAPMMQMVSLLHYVNRKLLRSIVAGTLAYDLFQDPDLGANCQYNDNSSAGTYVVSLSIQGRQGKFLNIGELRRVAGLVERYAGAVQTWILNRQTWNMQDPSDVMKRNFIIKVDNMASRADAGGIPLFGTNRAAVEKCEELVKMFRRRAVTSLDIQNQGQTYQIQAPMMVGCTGETIAKQTKSHYPQMTAVNPLVPAASSLMLTTKTWGLTVSLLYYMGMKPEIIHVAALPFIYSADLPRTEMLLTTLARSFVWQDGFNIIQGGSKSDSHSSNRGKAEEKNICYARDFLKSNLSATLQRMQEIRNKIAIIKNLSQVNLDALEAEVTKLQAKESELELEVMQLNKVEAEFMKGHERMKEIEKEQDKQIQLWTAWNGLLDFKEKEGSF